MNKRQINAVKKVIAYTRNAIAQGGGYYMPSDYQTAALYELFSKACCAISKREYARFSAYLVSIVNANLNEVYTVCADEKQLAAVEKALSLIAA